LHDRRKLLRDAVLCRRRRSSGRPQPQAGAGRARVLLRPRQDSRSLSGPSLPRHQQGKRINGASLKQLAGRACLPGGGCGMRMAVMAAGAVGGYFGAHMAAAGHDVAFIARGAHRDAIRRGGLKVESGLGDLHLKDVRVTDDPREVGPVELVLFAVKLWDTETAGAQARPLVGANTRVVTLQNGVDSVERLVPMLGDDATIQGATYVVTNIASPGVIRHTGTIAKILCGRLDGRPDPLLTGYVEQIK